MLITNNVLKTVVEAALEDVICNKCGGSCKSFMGSYYGLIEAQVSGGYESSHLGDETEWRFSMCEMCLYQLFKTFKIDPLVDEDSTANDIYQDIIVTISKGQ